MTRKRRIYADLIISVPFLYHNIRLDSNRDNIYCFNIEQTNAK